MGEVVVIIMEKDSEHGFLTNEIASCKIYENEPFLVNIYAVKQGEIYAAHVRLSTSQDAVDWEFDAIYDYYDSEVFAGQADSVIEVEDCFNPTWEAVMRFTIDAGGKPSADELCDSGICYGIEALEERLNGVLRTHAAELNDVYEIIKDKKDDYNN